MNSSATTLGFAQDNFVVFGLVTGVIIVALNIVALYLVTTSRTIACQIKSLLLNLSAIDLQFGIVITLPFLVTKLIDIEPKWILNVGKLVIVTSYFFTMVIAVDRVISVTHPNFYLLHGTEERITKINRMFWMAYVALILLLLIALSVGVSFTDVVMDICLILVYVTTTICVVFSAFVLHRHYKRQLKSLRITGVAQSRMSVLKNYKTTIVLLSICLSLIVFCFPAVISVSIRVINYPLYQSLQNFQKISRAMSIFNHIVNPFLYSLRFRECRDRLFNCFGGKRNKVACQHVNVEPTTGTPPADGGGQPA